MKNLFESKMFKRCGLDIKQWRSPNSYGNSFESPPNSPGVYILASINLSTRIPKCEILYIGSSRNLLRRYKNHEVIKALNERYGFVKFYFLETESFYEEERRLIRTIKPRCNTHLYGGRLL